VEAESKKKMPMMTSSDELWPAQKLFFPFFVNVMDGAGNSPV
jgi:hypothetical protein